MARPITQIKTGERFGRLTFINENGYDENGNRTALFSCDCGREKIIRVSYVTGGQSLSCGCKRGGGKFELITEEEKKQIIELSEVMSIKQICKRFKHDRLTIYRILGIEEPKEEPKEGFFDVDAFFRSDFILQA